MDAHTRQLLLLDNRWLEGETVEAWTGRHLPASYIPRRSRLVSNDQATMVVGPRQCGKSTLIWKTLAEDGRPTLYLNCEEISVRQWLRSPAELLLDLEAWIGEVPDLFFEEIQHLEEAGLLLEGLVDRKLGHRIFATGSSSFDLAARSRESLAGRARRTLLLPLSLAEISLTFGGSRLARSRRLESAVDRLAIFGSYPRVHNAGEPAEELAGLVEAVVVRDASDRFRIQHTAAFRRVLELAASQIGNLANLAEWASLAGVSSHTVAEYCRLLEEMHILRFVRPFVGGKRAELTGARKVYFLDNGVRNQLFGGFGSLASRADRRALLENLAFTEIAKSVHPLLDTVAYWRSKSGAEVDFVVTHQGRLLAIEIKAGDERGRITRSARSFVEAYAPDQLLIVNRAQHPAERLGSTAVRFLPFTELAGAVESFLAS